MPLLLRLFGALIVTFFLSRLIGRMIGGAASGVVAVLLTHLASFVVLALFAGFLKAYLVHFLWDAGLIYLAPQLIWLTYDMLRVQPSR